jgi:hypothetical protein
MIVLVIGLAAVVIAFVIAIVFNMRFGRNLKPSGDTSSDLAPPPPSASIRISDEDKTTTTEQ